jgi:DNA-binding transcriptional regulator YdaS (Cro superfamily)
MQKVKFNYSKLKGKIVEVCGTQKVFADRLGVSEGTLTSKLLGYTYFSQDEILRSMEILGISAGRTSEYFFTV